MKKPFVVEVRAGAKQRSVPNLSEVIRRLVELGLQSKK
jgi:hypothetical protein